MDPLGPDGEQQHPQNVVSIDIFPADVWRWSAMEAGGETVGFRWDMEYRGRFTIFSGAPQVLGLVSCAGAMEEVNCLNFHPGKWAEQIPDELNYDFTYRGLRVTQTVTVDGPRPELQTSDYIAFPEDQEGTISVTFTVQRA